MQEQTICFNCEKTKSPAADDQRADQKTRLHLWEVEHPFKCPVIGMCLTLSEQRQLLKKTDFSSKKKSLFEIHEMLVASADKENRLSRRADNLLHRKYGKCAESMLGFGLEEFAVHFRTAFQSGEFLDVLWAAAIHPQLPLKLKREFFGEVHMTMHHHGEQSLKLKQRVARQEEELGDMRQALKEAARQRRALQKENEILKRSQADLRARLARADKEKVKIKKEVTEAEDRPRLNDFEQENQTLKETVDTLCRRLKENEEQKTRLSSELDRQRDMYRQFSREAQEVIEELVNLTRVDETCPSFDLCQKRILIVGGITKIESLYRKLIESSNGIFEYHDGYMKKGVKQLESRLKRADLVLCPVTCNSHAACSIVKNLAKKHNKTVQMMASSSLSAVSQVIRGTENRKGTVN